MENKNEKAFSVYNIQGKHLNVVAFDGIKEVVNMCYTDADKDAFAAQLDRLKAKGFVNESDVAGIGTKKTKKA